MVNIQGNTNNDGYMLIDLFSYHMSFTLQSKLKVMNMSLGEMIVPQTFKKVTLTKEDTLRQKHLPCLAERFLC